MTLSSHGPRGVLLSSGTFASLRLHHNYRLYFSGQFLSQIGTWLQSAAMAWLVLQLTHSAFAVGLLAFWQFGPYAVLGLFGGALAEWGGTQLAFVVGAAPRWPWPYSAPSRAGAASICPLRKCDARLSSGRGVGS
jgi:Transmembrane secretion effector